ncbi:MAG: ATP-dependent DNA ligase [bacterium]|nr:ATP-dependent DNA ligase [bacterium]
MKFSQLAEFFQQLEGTPSRNSMIEILSEMFSRASSSESRAIAYLSQGRIAPLFVPLEFGMADKMVIRAIALAFGKSTDEVQMLFKREGDLGKAAEKLWGEKKEVGRARLGVEEVFAKLKEITETNGAGSVDKKTVILADLLKDAAPLSVRYICRIPVGRLRLGFSDMTVLDALSWTLTGSKSGRVEIERAYNVRPDLGFIAYQIKEKGLKGLEKVEPQVGTPILMARAERLSSAKDIIDKIGKCAVEPKIDGFRLAVHKDGDGIKLFTRNMEEVTFMYPDLVEGVTKQIKAKKVILEGEAIAYNPQTGEYLPFQETVQRKRKYGIAEKALSIPLKLISFDLLYLEGENLINNDYIFRREKLRKIIGVGETVILSEEKIVDDPKELEIIFQDAISRGLEGIMAKRLDGVYQAGARGWNWIKYKRSYQGKLEDTIDAVVMGYDSGQGKRSGFGIGDFLIGVYDQKKDMFASIAKIGTGLSDEEWRKMKKECDEIISKQKPARFDVDKMMECDIWVEPEKVVVVRADEITRSPVHTAGRVLKRSKSGSAWDVETPGFALRFPRLIEFRSDKSPEDATSVREIEEMYNLQGRKEK